MPGGRVGLSLVGPPSLSRRRWLLLLPLLLAAALAVLLWPEPEPTALPAIDYNPPRIELPPIDVDVPDPEVQVQGPSGSRGGEVIEKTTPPAPPPPPPDPEYKNKILHEHHEWWLWDLNPWLMALAGLGAALAWQLSRVGSRLGWAGRALAVAALTGLATLAFVVGINPRAGDGIYSRKPAEIERIDGVPEVIVRHIHIDHFHPPIDIAAHWLLLGVGLALVAVWTARPLIWAGWKRRRAATPV